MMTGIPFSFQKLVFFCFLLPSELSNQLESWVGKDGNIFDLLKQCFPIYFNHYTIRIKNDNQNRLKFRLTRAEFFSVLKKKIFH